MPLIIDTSVDNTGLRSGLGKAEGMIDASVRRMGARMASVGAGFGTGAQWSLGKLNQLNNMTTGMNRMVGVSGRLNQSLDRMGGMFNSALGIGAALGGFALLERAFTRSIEKAREFQTAQIAIAATLQSAYKITDKGGKEVEGPAAFQYASQQAQRFNTQIIQRQARNILVYQEQLGAFQSSLASGARKGLNPQQILELSESAAIVAKTLGLRGEQIANASRLLMGGGVNVGRSTIGRALGVSNVDVTTRSGQELFGFLKDKMKGFMTPEIQQSFGKSIEGVMSALESKFDIFWAKVGKGFMAKISPALEELGKVLEGTDAEKFAGTLSSLFLSVFKALEAIVRSPAIPVIMKFVEFLSRFGDKIIIGSILLKLAGILGATGTKVLGFASHLEKLAATAIGTAKAVDSTTASIERNAAASGMMGGVPMAARMGGKAIAGEATMAATWALSAKQQATVSRLMAEGTPASIARANNLAKGYMAQRLSSGALLNTPEAIALHKAGQAAVPAAQANLNEFMAGAAIGGVPGGAATAAVTGATTKPGWWANRWKTPTYAAWGEKLKPMGAGALRGGMYGLMADLGIQMGSSALGLNKTPTGSAITNVLGGSVGGAITGSMIAPGVGTAIGAVIGATIGGLQTLSASLKSAADAADVAAADLRSMKERYPLGTELADLNAKKRQITEAIKTGKIPNVDAEGNPLGGKAHWYSKDQPWTVKDPYSVKYEKAQLKKVNDRITEIKEQGALITKANTEATKAQEEVAFWQNASKLGGMGYGLENKKNALEISAKSQLAELEQMRVSGQMKPSDADLVKRWKSAQEPEELSIKDQEKLTPKDRTRMEKEAKERNEERYKINEEQYRRTKKQIVERQKDQESEFALEIKKQAAELDIRPVGGEYLRGKLGVQQQILGQKELLGPDYEKTLKKALANYDLMFNKPLKEIEQKMQALALGVDTENVMEAATGAFQAARAKIHQLVEIFRKTGEGLSPEEGHRLLAQREEQFKAIQLREGYIAPRRLTQMSTAQSEIAQKMAAGRAAMAGAEQKPETAGVYGLISKLEGERRSEDFLPTEFQRYQSLSLQKARQDILRNKQSKQLEGQQFGLEERARSIQEQMAGMNLPQAKMGVEQAQYQQQMFESSLNPRNARMMERAQRIVGRQQPRIGLDEATKLVEEGISLQRRGLGAATKKAKFDEQLAEIANQGIGILSKQNDLAATIKWEDLAKVVGDSTEALRALSNYAKGIVGGVATPDAKKSGKAKSGAIDGGTAPPINISIAGGTTLTEKDIDNWMPKIREKLCRLAAQSGGRG